MNTSDASTKALTKDQHEFLGKINFSSVFLTASRGSTTNSTTNSATNSTTKRHHKDAVKAELGLAGCR
jgi:hypothetical protein